MSPEQLQLALVLANEPKEGDLVLGGTLDAKLRNDARAALSALTARELSPASILDDGVGRMLARSLDRTVADELGALTIRAVKDRLLADDAARFASRCAAGLSSEAIAAVAKIMSDDELARVSTQISNPRDGDGVAIGGPRHFGSRIQPNSAGDDPEEILFSILEGLAYGCGDVIIGLNPASDDLDTIVALEELLASVVERLALPTRFCVLSDIIKQERARARTRVDVGFQSLAGTSRALRGLVGLDGDEIAAIARGFDGLYFETGQGSEVTNGAAEGIDMVTLESRTYGVARAIARSRPGTWMIVNDVAGFIGPEVFRTGAQLERACLEDAVMAKLHGLTMGLDVCSTFHMGIDPGELAKRTRRIAERAAPAYLMAVAGNADPMLGYLTTSFREHPRLRRALRKRMTSAMEGRLNELGVLGPDGSPRGDAETVGRLYAAYARAGGDRSEYSGLASEGERRLRRLRERGLDLGHGRTAEFGAPPEIEARIASLFAHARRALYATLDAGVLAAACPRHVRARTLARDREDFLAHPPSGERLRDADLPRIAAAHPERRPDVQIVASDGLNAEAANEQLRALLPSLRQALSGLAVHVSRVDVVLDDARVRAGYHVGAVLDVPLLVHLIGERPGTGLNTLSAYLTYGRDEAGRSRWSPDLEHSATTLVAGIHPHGTSPERAAEEIGRTASRILRERRSGVALSARA